MPISKPSPATLVVRTVLWIVISTVFMLQSLHHLSAARLQGQSPGVFAYIQPVIWAVALVFWLIIGWRDWTRRDQ